MEKQGIEHSSIQRSDNVFEGKEQKGGLKRGNIAAEADHYQLATAEPVDHVL